MCFSAEVDLAAGLLVGAVGVDAVRHVQRRGELLLALLPVVLGVHQLVEAVVWWGLEDQAPYRTERAAVWLYLVIAFGVIPLLVPLAAAQLEPAADRARMAWFAVAGAVAAAVLLHAVVTGPVVARVEGYHVDYRVDLWHGGVVVGLYVLATCGALLASRHAHVRRYGAVNLAVVVLLTWVDQRAFISLWCVWAAVTSVAIALHLRQAHRLPAGSELPVV
jgi:hypothetical protein